MKLLQNNKGFTLVELVMVIVILGILASVAVPKFTDLQGKAQTAAEEGTVGGVRAGINTIAMGALVGAVDTSGTGITFSNLGFPSSLDSTGASDGAASGTNPLFTTVLNQGVVDPGWSKASDVYTGNAQGVYTYTQTSGQFLKTN